MKDREQLLAEYDERMRPEPCKTCRGRGFWIRNDAVIIRCECSSIVDVSINWTEIQQLVSALLDRADAR